MKKIVVLLLCTIATLVVKSQSIDFTTVGKANESYTFYFYNGTKIDTIAQGMTDGKGRGQIKIPVSYRSVPALGALVLGTKGVELIVNNENISLQIGADNSLTFKNTVENQLLYHEQSKATLDEYKNTYVYSYLKTKAAVAQLAQAIQPQNKQNLFMQSSARSKALNDVDVDKLYYSNSWFYLIDGLMRLSIGQEGFANDMIRLLNKTKNTKVYVAFVEDLITITNQYGMDDSFDLIIPHVEASGRIAYPQGEVFTAFAMAKVRRGMTAPDVDGLKPALGKTDHKYTMLIFYQPGCDNCKEQLTQLIGNHNFFKDRGVRIVTLSGADDKASFDEESKNFLWNDTLCDFKGFAGGNFLKYGIMASPTIYLLNNNNTVLGRFALISEVERFIRGRD